MDQGEVDGDDDVDAGVGGLVFDFLFGVERVEVDDRGAGFEDGVVHDDEIRGVGQAEADFVAFFDAEALQAGGGAGGEIADLGVGIGFSEKIDAGPGGEFGGGFIEHRISGDAPELEIGEVFSLVGSGAVLVHDFLRHWRGVAANVACFRLR